MKINNVLQSSESYQNVRLLYKQKQNEAFYSNIKIDQNHQNKYFSLSFLISTHLFDSLIDVNDNHF